MKEIKKKLSKGKTFICFEGGVNNVFLAHSLKIYQIQQHPQTGVTAVAVAAPQGSYIQQQGVTPEQASLAASEAQQQQ